MVSERLERHTGEEGFIWIQMAGSDLPLSLRASEVTYGWTIASMRIKVIFFFFFPKWHLGQNVRGCLFLVWNSASEFKCIDLAEHLTGIAGNKVQRTLTPARTLDVKPSKLWFTLSFMSLSPRKHLWTFRTHPYIHIWPVRYIAFPPCASSHYYLYFLKKSINSFKLSLLITGSNRRSMPQTGSWVWSFYNTD